MKKLTVLLSLVLMPSLAVAQSSAQAQWLQTNGPYGQRYAGTGTIAEDKKGNLFAATNWGLWRSTNDGETWKIFLKAFQSPYGIGAWLDSSNLLYTSCSAFTGYSDDLAEHWRTFKNPGFPFVVSELGHLIGFKPTGDSVFRSTDIGKSWIGYKLDSVYPESYMTGWWGDTIIRILYGQSCFELSGDFGKSWTRHLIDSTFAWGDPEITRINHDDVWARVSARYYLSHDRGEHFKRITAPTSGGAYFISGPQSGTYLTGTRYVPGSGGHQDTVQITFDDGVTWQPLSLLLGHHEGFEAAVCTHSNAIIIGGDTNFISRDSGRTWSTCNTVYSFSDRFEVRDHALWSYYENLIQVSTDLGDSWQNITAPVGVGQLGITKSGTLVVNGWYDDLYASSDTGKTWQKILEGWTQDPWSGLTVVGDTILVVHDTSLFVSSSSGKQWDSVVFPDTLFGHATQHVVVTSRGELWLFVEGDSMTSSGDLGKTFSPLRPSVASMEYRFDQDGNAYAINYSSILRSSNSGVAWDTIPLPTHNSRDEGFMDLYRDSAGILISFSIAGVHRTTNDGATWTKENSGIDDRISGYLASQDGYSFLSTDGGVYRKKDSLSIPGSFMRTYPISIVRPRITPTTGGVVTTSSRTALFVTPNPFSYSTAIHFTLASPEFVRITVYDAEGREVAKVASGQYDAGQHEAAFDAEQLPAGVYFYRVTAGGKSQVGSMVRE